MHEEEGVEETQLKIRLDQCAVNKSKAKEFKWPYVNVVEVEVFVSLYLLDRTDVIYSRRIKGKAGIKVCGKAV